MNVNNLEISKNKNFENKFYQEINRYAYPLVCLVIVNVVKKIRMSGYGRPCKSHRLKLDLVQSGFSENEGLSGVFMFVGSQTGLRPG